MGVAYHRIPDEAGTCGNDQELAGVGAAGLAGRAGAGLHPLRRALADGAGMAPDRRVPLDRLGHGVLRARLALDAIEPADLAAPGLGRAADLLAVRPQGVDPGRGSVRAGGHDPDRGALRVRPLHQLGADAGASARRTLS